MTGLGFRGGFELNMYANRLGLNHWDIIVGMVPWLRTCEREGLLNEINGMPLDWNSTPSSGSILLHESPTARAWAMRWPRAACAPRAQLGLGEELCGATIPAGAIPATGMATPPS